MAGTNQYFRAQLTNVATVIRHENAPEQAWAALKWCADQTGKRREAIFFMAS
jgi:hypothetical protein